MRYLSARLVGNSRINLFFRSVEWVVLVRFLVGVPQPGTWPFADNQLYRAHASFVLHRGRSRGKTPHSNHHAVEIRNTRLIREPDAA